VKRPSEFEDRLQRLIGRIEAWSYADADPGAGVPQELAAELKRLAAEAPTQRLRAGVRRAQDALDDGLSAEAVAAALYRVRAEFEGGIAQGSEPPPPSPSR
jgi:hypothetical protein